MSTTAPRFALRQPHLATSNGHAPDPMRENLIARMTLLERTSAMQAVTPRAVEPEPPAESGADFAHDLPARMRQLIELEGSAAAIAERCGFSAGAVRSWRDGHSDISRERCTVMAQALNISLLWLVAGDGPMRINHNDATHSAAISAVPAPGRNRSPDTHESGLDSKRLAASLRLLQSYIGLVGGSLAPATRADLLAELYDILGDVDDADRIDHLIAFHSTLSDQLRRNRALIA